MMKSIILLITIFTICYTVDPITFTYKKVKNVDIILDVYVPKASRYAKYPVVFIIHGGGYLAGTTKYCSFSNQQLDEILRRGWVGVSIDYRLAPAVFLDEIVQDCQDAYTWVRTELVKHVPIDPERITVFGGSAGGGLAVISGFKFSPPPKAIISFYPLCTNFIDPYCYNPHTSINETIVSRIKTLQQIITEHIVENETTDPRYVLFLDALYSGKMGWLLMTQNPDESIDLLHHKLKEFSAVHMMDKIILPLI